MKIRETLGKKQIRMQEIANTGERRAMPKQANERWRRLLLPAIIVMLVFCGSFVSYGKAFSVSDEELTTRYDPVKNDYYFDLSFTYHGTHQSFLLVVYLNGVGYKGLQKPLYVSSERVDKYIRWVTPTTDAGGYQSLKIQKDYSAYFDGLDHNNTYTAVSDAEAKLHFRLVIRNVKEGVTGIGVIANMDSQNIANGWGGESGWDVQSDLTVPVYEGTLVLTATVPVEDFSSDRGYPVFRFAITGDDGKKKYCLLAMQADSPVQNGQYVLQKTIPLSGCTFTITQKPVAVYAMQEAQTVSLTEDGQSVQALFPEQVKTMEKEAFVTVKIH